MLFSHSPLFLIQDNNIIPFFLSSRLWYKVRTLFLSIKFKVIYFNGQTKALLYAFSYVVKYVETLEKEIKMKIEMNTVWVILKHFETVKTR